MGSISVGIGKSVAIPPPPTHTHKQAAERGSTGAPCPRRDFYECEILTLTLWASHGKIEPKSRRCPRLDGAVPPLVPPPQIPQLVAGPRTTSKEMYLSFPYTAINNVKNCPSFWGGTNPGYRAFRRDPGPHGRRHSVLIGSRIHRHPNSPSSKI